MSAFTDPTRFLPLTSMLLPMMELFWVTIMCSPFAPQAEVLSSQPAIQFIWVEYRSLFNLFIFALRHIEELFRRDSTLLFPGLQNGVINSCRRYGLGLNETILPQYLKKLGYATYGLGKVDKDWMNVTHLEFWCMRTQLCLTSHMTCFSILWQWHLGFYTENYIPSNRGFDYYFGMYAGTGDYWTHCYDTESYGVSFAVINILYSLPALHFSPSSGAQLFARGGPYY